MRRTSFYEATASADALREDHSRPKVRRPCCSVESADPEATCCSVFLVQAPSVVKMLQGANGLGVVFAADTEVV